MGHDRNHAPFAHQGRNRKGSQPCQVTGPLARAFQERVPDNGNMENTFDGAREGLRSTGAGKDARELVEMLARHGEEEGAILSRYQRFAEDASAPETRYLVKLIVDDERRNHGLLVEMANAIAWGLIDESADPVLPDMTHKDASNRALAEETQRLILAEEYDHVELKRLRKRLRTFKNTSLWELIVDLMLLDTEKHIRILRLVAKNTESA